MRIDVFYLFSVIKPKRKLIPWSCGRPKPRGVKASSCELCVGAAFRVASWGKSIESRLRGVINPPYQLGDSEMWYRGLCRSKGELASKLMRDWCRVVGSDLDLSSRRVLESRCHFISWTSRTVWNVSYRKGLVIKMASFWSTFKLSMDLSSETTGGVGSWGMFCENGSPILLSGSFGAWQAM